MYESAHGGDIYGFEEAVLDFSANINPLGMPQAAREALAYCADACVNYPDPQCRELRRLLSRREDIPAERIVCGNGAADIIFRAVIYKKPKTALLPAPTFSEYEEALKCVGCEINYYRLEKEKEFAVGEDILEKIHTLRPDMIFLCNPNNPTGQITDAELVRRIGLAAEEISAMLVIDECFMDFVDGSCDLTAKPLLKTGGEILILKAFTKFYAMPGLRLGYGLASENRLAVEIKKSGAEWAVSVPAQLCGCAALKDMEYADKTLRLIRGEREYLKKRLGSMGFSVYGSKANYIFFKSEIIDLRERLIGEGILIRSCDNYVGLCEGYYRVAVKNRRDNETLIRAVESIVMET